MVHWHGSYYHKNMLQPDAKPALATALLRLRCFDDSARPFMNVANTQTQTVDFDKPSHPAKRAKFRHKCIVSYSERPLWAPVWPQQRVLRPFFHGSRCLCSS